MGQVAPSSSEDKVSGTLADDPTLLSAGGGTGLQLSTDARLLV